MMPLTRRLLLIFRISPLNFAAALLFFGFFYVWGLRSLGIISRSIGSARTPSPYRHRPADDIALVKGQGGGSFHSAHNLTCTIDMNHLRALAQRHNLEDAFTYVRRSLKLIRSEGITRKPLTDLNYDLLSPDSRIVNASEEYIIETCPDVIPVPVANSAFPGQANLSEFMFGISTTFGRFNDSAETFVDEWSYWLTDSAGHSNGAKLIMLLNDASESDLRNVQLQLREAGIDIDVCPSRPETDMAVRYLSLLPIMYSHPHRTGKKWLALCDDDTFFPYPNSLADRFKTFDPSRRLYIGAMSEDAPNIALLGTQAFGGAGIFLSIPMAQDVIAHFNSCTTPTELRAADIGWGTQGDMLLRNCIRNHTDITLTVLPELWQLDFLGDPSGFYESGIKPLSIHHYHGGMWHVARPARSARITHLCGEDCFMQRFRTADDFIISTGFSVAQYPGVSMDLNFDQMERTFVPLTKDQGWNFDFKMGPQRESLSNTGSKMAWELRESEVREDGRVNQVYIRRAKDLRWTDDRARPMSRVDGVIELVWM